MTFQPILTFRLQSSGVTHRQRTWNPALTSEYRGVFLMTYCTCPQCFWIIWTQQSISQAPFCLQALVPPPSHACAVVPLIFLRIHSFLISSPLSTPHNNGFCSCPAKFALWDMSFIKAMSISDLLASNSLSAFHSVWYPLLPIYTYWLDKWTDNFQKNGRTWFKYTDYPSYFPYLQNLIHRGKISVFLLRTPITYSSLTHKGSYQVTF
jgi:hypothetical protein